MNSDAKVFLVIVIGMFLIPISMSMAECSTAKSAMEHGYIQVKGQWVKPEQQK
jgi:hypothetical protein